MSILIEPEEIVNEFLRANVTELVRRNEGNTADLANRQSNDTQTFSATSGQTEFVITDNVPIACIKEVTIEGTKIYKYIDYDIDLDNNKIILKTGATLSDEIIIDYDYGSNWCYPDKPIDSLSYTSYPRVATTLLTISERQRGMSDDFYYKNITMQIDVLGFKEQLCYSDSELISETDVVNAISRNIVTQIKTKWRDEMRGALFNFNIISNNPVPFNEGTNQFRRIIEISCDGEDS
jgi:hypothetical protein